MTTLDVLTPTDVDVLTLEWVNHRRAELGLEGLSELPDGVPGHMNKCPIARALTDEGYTGWAGATTAGSYFHWEEPRSWPMPDYVQEWIHDFDHALV